MNSDKIFFSIIVFLLIVNLFSFIVMLFDKRKSILSRSRVSEATLFFLASFFGGIGIYLGMFMFRHKTRKWHFYIGMPLLIFQNMAFLYLFYGFLVKIIIEK